MQHVSNQPSLVSVIGMLQTILGSVHDLVTVYELVAKVNDNSDLTALLGQNIICTGFLQFCHLYTLHTPVCTFSRCLHSLQIPVCMCMYTQVHVAVPDLKKQGVPCQLPLGLNDSNNVQWNVSMGADQELELRLVYTVEHPPQDAIEWA